MDTDADALFPYWRGQPPPKNLSRTPSVPEFHWTGCQI